MSGYNHVYLNSVPLIYAQIIPRVTSNNSTTINSEPDTTTTHTSSIIEGSNALLSSKLPMIKKAVISQICVQWALYKKLMQTMRQQF